MRRVTFNVKREDTEAYFSSLDRMLENRGRNIDAGVFRRFVRLGGEDVGLCFYSENIARIYAPQFGCNRIQPQKGIPMLHIWKGRYLDYLPRISEPTGEGWMIDNDDCRVVVAPWSGTFIACSKHSRNYYMCLADDSPRLS